MITNKRPKEATKTLKKGTLVYEYGRCTITSTRFLNILFYNGKFNCELRYIDGWNLHYYLMNN